MGNSYARPIERFFTESYRQMIVFDPRHSAKPIQEMVDSCAPDEALCVWHCTND